MEGRRVRFRRGRKGEEKRGEKMLVQVF